MLDASLRINILEILKKFKEEEGIFLHLHNTQSLNRVLREQRDNDTTKRTKPRREALRGKLLINPLHPYVKNTCRIHFRAKPREEAITDFKDKAGRYRGERIHCEKDIDLEVEDAHIHTRNAREHHQNFIKEREPGFDAGFTRKKHLK